MKWWDRMPWSWFSKCWALSQLFHSPLSLSQLLGHTFLFQLTLPTVLLLSWYLFIDICYKPHKMLLLLFYTVNILPYLPRCYQRQAHVPSTPGVQTNLNIRVWNKQFYSRAEKGKQADPPQKAELPKGFQQSIFKNLFCWSTVDLQCSDSDTYIFKYSDTHTHTHTHTHTFGIEYSSLCYTVGLLGSFNGPEPGGPESTRRKWKRERGWESLVYTENQ